MRIFSFSFLFNDLDTLPKGHILNARKIPNPMLTVNPGEFVTDGELRAVVMYEPAATVLINQGIKFLSENPDGTILVGCEYGKHRSVAVATAIADHFDVVVTNLLPLKMPLIN